MTEVRPLDRVIAACVLLLLAPLLALIAIMVSVASPGPVIYHATRAGTGGHPFTLYKFRSMVVGAESAGTKVTAAGDPRVTPLGRLLRRTKLDELPQLVNVVRGEMALVGPRPEDPALIDLSDELHIELYRFPPGITGAASLAFRNEEELLASAAATGNSPEGVYAQIAEEKIEIDLAYLRRRNLRSDLGIMARTVGSILRGLR